MNTSKFYYILITGNYSANDNSHTITLFVDNVQYDTQLTGRVGDSDVDLPFKIGIDYDTTEFQYFDGNIDELRFTKGIVRTSENHLRPLKPDEHTKLLLHFEGDDDTNTFVDSSNWGWKGLTTTDHNDNDAVYINAFTGVESLHTDNATITLHGSERYLQAIGLDTDGMVGTGLPLSTHQLNLNTNGTTRASITDSQFSITPNNSPESTSTTTGALTVSGGVGISGNIHWEDL